MAKKTKLWTADDPPHHINRRAIAAEETAGRLLEVILAHKLFPPSDAIKIAWQMAVDLDARRRELTEELVRKFNSASPKSLFDADDEEEGDDE